VQRSVDDAQARGFVLLLANPAHRRSSLVALTETGRAAVEERRARERDLLQRVADAVSPAEVTGCVVVLRQLLAAVSQPAVSSTERPFR
jgi:DNA-binding MarR family transcriptional regulator